MSNCNVCDGPGPHPEPCDCPCHGSRAVAEWLASPDGEAWSRRTFAPAEASHLGTFGAVLPQPWGKPWRPSQARTLPARNEHNQSAEH